MLHNQAPPILWTGFFVALFDAIGAPAQRIGSVVVVDVARGVHVPRVVRVVAIG